VSCCQLPAHLSAACAASFSQTSSAHFARGAPMPRPARSPELSILRLQAYRPQADETVGETGPFGPRERRGRRPLQTFSAEQGSQGSPRAQSPRPLQTFSAERGSQGSPRGANAGGAATSSGELGVPGAPASRECRRHSPTKQSGEYRARTGDLLVANQALSQLS
jgi:hypothetical protein